MIHKINVYDDDADTSLQIFPECPPSADVRLFHAETKVFPAHKPTPPASQTLLFEFLEVKSFC